MSSKNYLKLELNLFLFLTAQATTRWPVPSLQKLDICTDWKNLT
jgi:hypothetical protein